MDAIHINQYIIADPAICHGKPIFAGTRIMIWQILDMLTAGQTTDDIIAAWPDLTPEHVTAALDYAASLTRNNYVIVNTNTKIPA